MAVSVESSCLALHGRVCQHHTHRAVRAVKYYALTFQIALLLLLRTIMVKITVRQVLLG